MNARLLSHHEHDITQVRLYDADTSAYLHTYDVTHPWTQVELELSQLHTPPTKVRLVGLVNGREVDCQSVRSVRRGGQDKSLFAFPHAVVQIPGVSSQRPQPLPPQSHAAASAQTSELAMGLVAQSAQAQVEATNTTARYAVEAAELRFQREMQQAREDLKRLQSTLEVREEVQRAELQRIRDEAHQRYADEITKLRKVADEARADYDQRSRDTEERSQRRLKEQLEDMRLDRSREIEGLTSAHSRELARRDEASTETLRVTKAMLTAQLDATETRATKLERRLEETLVELESAQKKIRLVHHQTELEIEEERERMRRKNRDLVDKSATMEGELRLLREKEGIEHTQIVDLVQRISATTDEATRERLFSILGTRIGAETTSGTPFENMVNTAMQQVASNPRLLIDGISMLTNRGKRRAAPARPNAPALPPASGTTTPAPPPPPSRGPSLPPVPPPPARMPVPPPPAPSAPLPSAPSALDAPELAEPKH
jgi:hypothetical protein